MDKYFIVPIESLRRNSKILPTGKPSPLGDMVPLPPPRVTSAGKVVRKIQISKYFHINRGCQVLSRPWLQSVVAPDLGRGTPPLGSLNGYDNICSTRRLPVPPKVYLILLCVKANPSIKSQKVPIFPP